MVLMLSNQDVASVLTMDACMAALEDAFVEQAHGRAINQVRYDVNLPLTARPERKARYEFKTMVGLLPKVGMSALRMSSTLNHKPVKFDVERAERLYLSPSGGVTGLIQLYSMETGEPLAFMPDGVVQGMRVGGTFGLATKHLAREDASVMGLFGSGWQARFQVAATREVRNLKLVKVFSPTLEHRERFARDVSAEYGVPVKAVESPEEAAADVDILISATNAHARLIREDYVHNGMHVAAVQNEISNEAVQKADLQVTHTSKGYWVYEGGEGRGQEGELISQLNGMWDYPELPLLEDMIVGRIPGRTSADQITMFRGHGLGIQFAAVGALAYNLARARGLGHEIPGDWFVQTEHT
ncbi:MAG: ornithine cyclodeaminase family protein [Chloroflexi bacterium]|nr:ornithine cyclodeaminase family protein [Chloroflexota bacterium]